MTSVSNIRFGAVALSEFKKDATLTRHHRYNGDEHYRLESDAPQEISHLSPGSKNGYVLIDVTALNGPQQGRKRDLIVELDENNIAQDWDTFTPKS